MSIGIKEFFCSKVKNVAYILGILCIVYSFFKTVFYSFLFDYFEKREESDISYEPMHIGVRVTIFVLLVAYFFFFLSCVLMFYGIKIKEYGMMSPWLIFTIPFIVLTSFTAFYTIDKGYRYIGFINLIDPIFSGFCYIYLYSYYKMEEKD